MTVLQHRAILALSKVKMTEKTWHVRRREELYGIICGRSGVNLLTAEDADLWYLVWRYRRQITDVDVVQHAQELITGAMSLSFN